jgi:hypothetical protein
LTAPMQWILIIQMIIKYKIEERFK